MTKEEMAKAYADGFENKDYQQIAFDAFVCGYTAKCKSSLPLNLDDAAWEYFLKTYGIDNIAISEDIKRAVKFGAEWMAGQGITVEGTLGKDESAGEDPYYFITERSERLSEWAHKNASWDSTMLYLEPYIIQIRKKQ